MKPFYPIILLISLAACGGSEQMEKDSVDSPVVIFQPKVAAPDTVRQAPSVNVTDKSTIEVRTFQNKTTDEASGTWGYDIYIDNVMRFHQPSIPAVAGIRGFNAETDARKTGELVAYKIKHNILPPSVTQQELDSIGVLH